MNERLLANCTLLKTYPVFDYNDNIIITLALVFSFAFLVCFGVVCVMCNYTIESRPAEDYDIQTVIGMTPIRRSGSLPNEVNV